MSVEAITWALKLPIDSSPAKFVLVALANCASGDTMTAHPSIAYLVEATSQDRKTVINNMRKLREWGLIEDTGERKGATKQVIVYRLRGPDLLATVPKTDRFQKRNRPENGTVPIQPGNSPVFPPKEAQKRNTEPSEPSGNQERDTAGAKTTSAGELAAGIAKKLGPKCGITSIQPKTIAAAADGVTAAMVLETHQAHPDKTVHYALTVAHNQLLEGKQPGSPRARAGPGSKPRANDDFSKATYTETPDDQLPAELRAS